MGGDAPAPLLDGYAGGHAVRLLTGGDELFPAMAAAIDHAQREVWLATYIFFDDAAAQAMATRLAAAARRGVRVRVVVDGFGSKSALPALRAAWRFADVELAVFRPVDRWWALLQPGQLRRQHQKLCVVDGELAFVGGVNIVDDRVDVHHGETATPRLDFAVEVRGPVVPAIEQAARAVWTRAALGSGWRDELAALLRSSEPLARARALTRSVAMRLRHAMARPAPPDATPVRVAFVVRDNLRERRSIEHRYVDALQRSRRRIDLVSPYFYPGTEFRRTLRDAARRGVEVRLLLQGKLDYRIAGIAARVLYDELLSHGVRVFEYVPAYLHAKVAMVDDAWATVGSSNIDPLSLLLNLEANLFVDDAAFTQELRARFELALAASREVTSPTSGRGGWAMVKRGLVAWCAHWYLRVAGLDGRY